MDRAHKIARRLDPVHGNAMDGCPLKPKGMRWRTYRRLEAELEHYEALGVARMMRSLSRGIR